MAYLSSLIPRAVANDEVVEDFVPGPGQDAPERIQLQNSGSPANCCERVRESLLANQLVFHSIFHDSVLLDGLQDRKSEVYSRLAADYHRLVVLDLARGLDARGAFDLVEFYRYAFVQFERAFEIPQTELYHEQDLLQILKDERQQSLVCLVNVQVAESQNRKRLRSLTQEGHPTLIVYRMNNCESGTKFELCQDTTDIGRHPSCDIVVDVGAVSRYHAKVSRKPDGFVVEDAGSRNGTFLNSQLLTGAHILREGDRIRVSDVEFVFHSDDVPGFVGTEMTFDGANFGNMMHEDSLEEDFQQSGD